MLGMSFSSKGCPFYLHFFCLYNGFLTYFAMSIKEDSIFICPKFWKTFKSEVTTDWELVDKQRRISNVQVIEYE